MGSQLLTLHILWNSSFSSSYTASRNPPYLPVLFPVPWYPYLTYTLELFILLVVYREQESPVPACSLPRTMVSLPYIYSGTLHSPRRIPRAGIRRTCLFSSPYHGILTLHILWNSSFSSSYTASRNPPYLPVLFPVPWYPYLTYTLELFILLVVYREQESSVPACSLPRTMISLPYIYSGTLHSPRRIPRAGIPRTCLFSSPYHGILTLHILWNSSFSSSYTASRNPPYLPVLFPVPWYPYLTYTLELFILLVVYREQESPVPACSLPRTMVSLPYIYSGTLHSPRRIPRAGILRTCLFSSPYHDILTLHILWNSSFSSSYTASRNPPYLPVLFPVPWYPYLTYTLELFILLVVYREQESPVPACSLPRTMVSLPYIYSGTLHSPRRIPRAGILRTCLFSSPYHDILTLHILWNSSFSSSYTASRNPPYLPVLFPVPWYPYLTYTLELFILLVVYREQESSVPACSLPRTMISLPYIYSGTLHSPRRIPRAGIPRTCLFSSPYHGILLSPPGPGCHPLPPGNPSSTENRQAHQL